MSSRHKPDLRRLPPALAPMLVEPRWVVWRWEPGQNGKRTKVPYRAQCPARRAANDDPSSWTSYEAACAALVPEGPDGIGYMLMHGKIAAFDLDDCRDPDTGVIAPWAWELIEEAGSYTEITVSGTGVRILGTATGQHMHRNLAVPGTDGRIECYRRAKRYIVVTGDMLEGFDRLLPIDDVMDRTVARLDEAAKSRGSAKSGSAQFDFNNARTSGTRSSAFNELLLPDALAELIRQGVPIGGRSQAFMRAIGWLKQLGWHLEEIEELLSRYPNGIASKYAGRLRAEIERCLGKAGQGTSGPNGNSGPNGPAPPPVRATPYVWTDPASIPVRDWIYGRHLARGYVSSTIAPGGAGKTALKVVEALAMVSGRDLLTVGWVRPRLRVWLWNLEDPREELTRRIQAAAIHHQLQAGDLDGLFVDSGRDQECIIAQSAKDGTVILQPVVDNIIAEIRRNEIDVLVLDPFVSSHRVSENDNSAIDLVVKKWGQVADARQGNCAIDLVHHTRKLAVLDSEVTTESSRGAKALTDACRSVVVVNRMSKDEGERAGVDDHRLYFRTYSDKANLAPPSDASSWYQLVSVDLGNGALGSGDSVGVVDRWKWPDPLDNVTVANLRAIQQRVAGGQWRENAQAKSWVGHAIAAVLSLDTQNKAHRTKIARMLKVWIANGMFSVVTGKDEKGNERPFVEVGQWAND